MSLTMSTAVCFKRFSVLHLRRFVVLLIYYFWVLISERTPNLFSMSNILLYMWTICREHPETLAVYNNQ